MKHAEYWWKEDATTVANSLMASHRSWDNPSTNPFHRAWMRNMVAYYSAVLQPSAWETSLSFAGEQGELVEMLVPQARTLVRQFVSLITKQKLSFQCIAQSDGADVVQETRLGNSLVNQIVDQQRLDGKADRLAELAAVLGISFLKATWRTDKGKPRAVDSSDTMLYDGDLEISVLNPFDVYFDYNISEWEDLDWVEVRSLKNRWTLIAQHPELEDEIKAIPRARDYKSANLANYSSTAAEDDYIYCFEAFHKPTPALPQGRLVIYADETTIFFDGPNRYMCIPVEPCRPEPVIGYGFGYPMLSNLLPAQEMLDHSFSALATNQSAFAVQSVTVPRGAAISSDELNGMNFIQFTPQNVPGGGKPEALQLTQSSPETFKYIELLTNNMQQLSNINSALRGQPPPGVTSGTAIATLTSSALEFITSFSKAYSSCLERTMMHAVNAYRNFASVPHMIREVGKNYQASDKEFVGSDLDPIKNIKISVSNPLMQTIAGRSDLAEKLLNMGVIKDAQEYLGLINGDDPANLYKTEMSENDLITSENDALLKDGQVVALSSDDHARHCREHAGLLNDPQVRFNNKAVPVILEHIQEHIQLARDTDPFFTALVRTGKMPEGGIPTAGMPAGAEGPPGGEPPIQMGGVSPKKPKESSGENPLAENRGFTPFDGNGQPKGPKPAKPSEPAVDLLKRRGA